MSESIEKKLHLKASPERVWEALTDPTELAGWFPDRTDLQPRQGAAGVFEWSGHGKYAVEVEEISEPTRLVWSWARDPNVSLEETVRTRVEWTLERRPDGGTDLHLSESGFVRPEDRRENDAGWDKELGELRDYLGGSV